MPGNRIMSGYGIRVDKQNLVHLSGDEKGRIMRDDGIMPGDGIMPIDGITMDDVIMPGNRIMSGNGIMSGNEIRVDKQNLHLSEDVGQFTESSFCEKAVIFATGILYLYE